MDTEISNDGNKTHREAAKFAKMQNQESLHVFAFFAASR